MVPTSLKRQRIGWYLFDFSGEILMINGGLYFLPWLTGDIGLSIRWNDYFNWTLIITSLALISTGPFLGRMRDRSNRKHLYLVATSFMIFGATLGIHLTDRLVESPLMKGIIALCCFSVLMYCYQLSLIFYNSRLGELTATDNYGKMSGFGSAAGWLGAIVGLFIVWPFVSSSGRAGAFFPSALFYAVGTIVSLYLMRGILSDSHPQESLPLRKAFIETWRDVWHALKKKDLMYFLLALFLFGDAVLTIQDNASFYLAEVMRFSKNATTMLVLVLLVMAAIGASVVGKLNNRVPPKKMLYWILIGWAIAIGAVSLTTSKEMFAVLFAVIGLLFGAQAGVTRALFLLLLPVNQAGQYFGMYASFQRFSTLIGPLVWVVVARGFSHNGVDAYRVSMVAMAGLICSSFFFLRKIHNKSC